MDHSEPPYDPVKIVGSWHELGWYFDGILIALMCSDKKAPGIFSFYKKDAHSHDDILRLLNKHEEEWIAEIESAISLISISGEIDLKGFSAEAAALVANRAEAVVSFIDSLHISERSIFGLPQMPFGDCIRWLLIDWWDAHGRQLAVDIFLSDQKP